MMIRLTLFTTTAPGEDYVMIAPAHIGLVYIDKGRTKVIMPSGAVSVEVRESPEQIAVMRRAWDARVMEDDVAFVACDETGMIGFRAGDAEGTYQDIEL